MSTPIYLALLLATGLWAQSTDQDNAVPVDPSKAQGQRNSNVVDFFDNLRVLKGALGGVEFLQTEMAFRRWLHELRDPEKLPSAQELVSWRRTLMKCLKEKEVARQCFSLRGLQALTLAGHEAELSMATLSQLIGSKQPAISDLALLLVLSIDLETEKACWKLDKQLGRLEKQHRSNQRIQSTLHAQRQQLLVRIKKMRSQKKGDAKARSVGTPGTLTRGEKLRISDQEFAALATLKNLCSSQAQVQDSGIIDSNANGAGEYGFFQDLTGTRPVHGRDPGAKPQIKVKPPLLSRAFAKPDTDGCVQRAGYYFRIFLPGTNGIPVHEGSPKDPFPPVSAPMAEILWCAYAWPVERGQAGVRSFFMNQRGDVWATQGWLTAYSGKQRTPSAYAAFHVLLDPKSPLATGQAKGGGAFDGNLWKVIN